MVVVWLLILGYVVLVVCLVFCFRGCWLLFGGCFWVLLLVVVWLLSDCCFGFCFGWLFGCCLVVVWLFL